MAMQPQHFCTMQSQEICTNTGSEKEAEYLVKWIGKAHIHNEWVPEPLLLRIAKRKVINFKRRYGSQPCTLTELAWTQPCRFICRRPCLSGPGWEVLVKWCDLGYEHATWEVSLTVCLSVCLSVCLPACLLCSCIAGSASSSLCVYVHAGLQGFAGMLILSTTHGKVHGVNHNICLSSPACLIGIMLSQAQS